MTAFTAPRRFVGRGSESKASKRKRKGNGKLGTSKAGTTKAGRIKADQRASSSRSLPWSSTPMLLVLTVGVLNIVGVDGALAPSVSSLTDYGSPSGTSSSASSCGRSSGSWPSSWGSASTTCPCGSVRPLLVVSAVLLVAVLIPGVGARVRLATMDRRRVPAFQPSDGRPALCSTRPTSRPGARRWFDWRRGSPVLVVLGGFVLLVMRQPDMGSAIVLAMVTVSVLVASGVRPTLAAVGIAGCR